METAMPRFRADVVNKAGKVVASYPMGALGGVLTNDEDRKAEALQCAIADKVITRDEARDCTVVIRQLSD